MVSTAPVKAPRSWPNSSDSKRLSSRVVQSTVTKGSSRLGEESWITRAMSSLPQPVSPMTSTEAWLRDNRPMVL